MRLFVDENLSPDIVDWLRAAKHDVTYAREIGRGTDDLDWLRSAARERRVIITADLDFGDHVFNHRRETAGVVQLRLYRTLPSLLLAVLIEHWPAIEPVCLDHFVTVTEGNIRIRPIG